MMQGCARVVTVASVDASKSLLLEPLLEAE